jgi:hypothetical protein
MWSEELEPELLRYLDKVLTDIHRAEDFFFMWSEELEPELLRYLESAPLVERPIAFSRNGV